MFRQRDREEERAARNKGANILRHTLGLTQLLKAGCVSLSRPTATEGAMHLAFPPYAKNRDQQVYTISR